MSARLSGVVLDSPDPRALAAFYRRLLGWHTVADEPGWVRLVPESGGTGLSFQHEPHYRRPEWPTRPDAPAMMAHLDFAVTDLATATEAALKAGAVLADWQPQERVRILLDPDGHPFCLFTAEDFPTA
ncbi:catechol 2,3-dioxygenase-like lactoylglutathione lyase family enzyme [Crossiella equi]|uniref:Catechol 2,3-dioxygenase-like lactoylglutathione lyase family enzyme n=1 Tax=Crossiella equi TaxID=130796 RepID=A0ABS5AG21_9PSEU|nr:VOC family protein [Crossiella equi]MBP2475164.1 catechol 2,3-dioxygenase-like lactoylglutathione lyase family enzyme [Crossiella equi]